MIQEEKELLLKDLTARLLYGFTIHRYNDNCDIVIESNGIEEFAHFLEYSEGEDFKPYLRPMSSMTDEERNILCSFTYGIEQVYLETGIKYCTNALDWLNKNHFDYRGLIEKGLALEASEEMYNIKEK